MKKKNYPEFVVLLFISFFTLSPFMEYENLKRSIRKLTSYIWLILYTYMLCSTLFGSSKARQRQLAYSKYTRGDELKHYI